MEQKLSGFTMNYVHSNYTLKHDYPQILSSDSFFFLVVGVCLFLNLLKLAGCEGRREEVGGGIGRQREVIAPSCGQSWISLAWS